MTPTLLIDEGGTAGNDRGLRHLLRMGTTRDLVAVRRDRITHAYGAKVLCWQELPNDQALNSRCILIPVTETSRTDLGRPTHPEVIEAADHLQKQLLQFRFDHYMTAELPKIPGAEKLRPRTRDLLLCVGAPSARDEKRCQSLLNHFVRQDLINREPLPPAQHAVLIALFTLVHQKTERGFWFLQDITTFVNSITLEAGQRIQLHPRKVGAALTSLGFVRRERTRDGWTLWIEKRDAERIHELAETYGLAQIKKDALQIPSEQCPLCQKYAKKWNRVELMGERREQCPRDSPSGGA